MPFSPFPLVRIELGDAGLYLFEDGNFNSYYRSITAHGLGMVFLFIMPGLISFVGNMSLPTSLNIVDFVTPRLNNFAFWLSVLSIELLLIGLSYDNGIAAG